jgi:hypothetical protein
MALALNEKIVMNKWSMAFCFDPAISEKLFSIGKLAVTNK